MSNPPTLLPPNSTKLESGLATAIARISDVPVSIDTLWNPQTCPVEILPWLAWALNLQTWDSTWSEDLKRQQINAAVDISRHKGTAKSVHEVVSSFGSGLALKEWWETSPQGAPYTFAITLTLGGDTPQTEAFQRQIMEAVDNAKPVRAHYSFTAGITSSGSLGLLAAVRPVIYGRLDSTGK